MKGTDRRWRSKNRKQLQNLWQEAGSFYETTQMEEIESDGKRMEEIERTVKRAKDVFYQKEAESLLTGAEFLYEQGKFIRKRWWLLQGGMLLGLWILLEKLESQMMMERCMGVAASFFAILLVPELWRNCREFVPEVEQVSYYSLRQVYAARICFLAVVDFFLLCSFFTAMVYGGRTAPEEMLIQFFFPYLVTCCICFRILYSKRKVSEVFVVFLCMLWCVFWTQIVLNDKVYMAILPSLWVCMFILAGIYLCYWIRKGQREWNERSEERWYGIKTV